MCAVPLKSPNTTNMKEDRHFHDISSSIRMRWINGSNKTGMTITLETHGQGIRPEGWINISVEGDFSDGPNKRRRQSPLSIMVEDEQAEALAQMLLDYVAQRKHLTKSAK